MEQTPPEPGTPPHMLPTPMLGALRSGPEARLRDWQPRLAPRYRLDRVLGQGGMGSVFLATDTKLDRQVAIKVVNNTLGQTAKRLERFRREGEITAGLDHPGIVGVYSAGVIDELPYLAYEYVTGATTLRDALGELSRRQRVERIRDIAQAIGFAHQHGVVHRDIKPENILCEPDGSVRVADFGLALAQGLERITSTGAVLGTPTYLAPEQASGRIHQIGPATDVWALGVMLYEALTGTLPFEGQTLAELLVSVCRATPEPPTSRDGSVPPGLEAVTLRALAGDPNRRYSTATELAADLDAWLSGGVVSAPQRRRGLDVRSFGLGLLVAASVGALVTWLAWPAAPGPAVAGTASPTPGPTPDDVLDAGERQWRKVTALPPGQQLEAVSSWLVAHPKHARRGAAEALRDQLRSSQPVLLLAPPQVNRTGPARFTHDGGILSLHDKGRSTIAVLWNDEGGEVRRYEFPHVRAPWLITHPRGFLVVPCQQRPPYHLTWCSWKGEVKTVKLPDNLGVVTTVTSQPETEDPKSWLLLGLGGRITKERGWLRVLRFVPSGRIDVETRVTWSGGPVEALAFVEGGSVLLVGSENAEGVVGGDLRAVQVMGGALLQSWATTHTGLRSLAVAPNGKDFAGGTRGGQIMLYRLGTKTAVGGMLGGERHPKIPGLRPAHPAIVRNVVFSLDGARLYSLSSSLNNREQRQLKIWTTADHRLERMLPIQDEHRWNRLDLSPDGERLLVAGDAGVAVWAVR